MTDYLFEEEVIEHIRYWKVWKYGETVVGEYLGRDVLNTYNKTPYRLKVLKIDFDTTTDITTGQILLLNECSSLNQRMKKMSEGDIIKVTYKGTKGDGDKAMTQLSVVKCISVSSREQK